MTQRPLPLNAIHAFIVTARHLNLTRAAAELCITQGAVSRKIAALEHWLGFTLFDRHARGLWLTPQGEALLPSLLAGYQQMQQAAEQASQQHAAIRLKAPTCAMRWLLPRLVALEKLRPELHVSLTTTVEHSRSLDKFDAVLTYGHDLTQGVWLFDESLTPVVAPEVWSEQSGNVTALAGLTFLHPTMDGRDWELWLQAKGADLTIKRSQHFATMDLAISAAIQGFGVTVADVALVAGDLAARRLVMPFDTTVKTGASWRLIHRPTAEAPPMLDKLVAWLTTTT